MAEPSEFVVRTTRAIERRDITKDIAVVEQGARMEAKTMTILLAPKPEVRARAVQLVAKRAEERDQEREQEREDDDEDDDD